MRVRLTGTQDECEQVIKVMRDMPAWEVLEVSGFYPNRGDSKLVRGYLDIRLLSNNPHFRPFDGGNENPSATPWGWD